MLYLSQYRKCKSHLIFFRIKMEDQIEDQIDLLEYFYCGDDTIEIYQKQNDQLRQWVNELLERIRYLESKIDSEVNINIPLKYQKALCSSQQERNKIMKFLSCMDFSDGSMTVHLLDMLSKINEEEKTLQMISLEMSNFNQEYDVEMCNINDEINSIQEVEEEIRNKLKKIELQEKCHRFDLKSLVDLPKYEGQVIYPTVYEHIAIIRDYMKERRLLE